MSRPRESSDSQPSKHVVVCLTKYIPYAGIPHAGGSYLLAHREALSALGNITMFAPPTPLNEHAMSQQGQGVEAHLLKTSPRSLKGLSFRFFQIEATLAGCKMYWPVRRLFRGSNAPWVALEQANLVELQWSEMISLAPSIRRKLPHQTLVGVAHDINTQRWTREATAGKSELRRAVAKFIANQSRKQESRSFGALDRLIVFSEKDAALARNLAPQTRVEVVHPGFKITTLSRKPHLSEPIALFVGAMNRPENWQGALWFLDRVWPHVLEQVPGAKFVIAGANPPKLLVDAVEKTPGAELTGFVESLDACYAEATVCVVPLLSGAGVKFKTIDALLSGVPVVTTSVGAEGIEGKEHFAAQTDDPNEFAAATIAALTESDLALALEARNWAESVYGEKAFTQRISDVYGEILDA